MQDIRCGTCSKKLGEGEFIALTIKCSRCKSMNHLRAMSSEAECHRASLSGVNIEQTDHSLDRRQTSSRQTYHPAVP
ncbi:Com family DNA-binding transcriptional regulator [Undibacterium luofuense]|uniref:Com family DNA-binding transcriptional regulator n=1 Tax=Undibacterium luofuense TaxID=2828733 RepID=A0A941DKV4_9BURK|nr:Com family DNA-binding transcriptional regulator [Undibacterium luofuense]MBR7782698.1 Com family DNA-binding transcriptional regulator [Undibacterium luofuense]